MSDYDAVFASVSGGKKKEPDEYDVVMQSIMPTAQSASAAAPQKQADKSQGFISDASNAVGTGYFKGLTSLAGLPVDTVANLIDLGKAAIGTPVTAITGKTPDWLQLTDRKKITGSGANILSSIQKTTAGRIFTQAQNPDYEGGYLQAAGGALNGVIAPNSIAQAVNQGFNSVAGVVAGKAVGDATGMPELAIAAGMSPTLLQNAAISGTKRFVRGDEAGRMRMEQRVQDLKNAGVDKPTLGLASGNTLLGGIENLLQSTPGAVNIMRNSRDAAVSGMQAKVDNAAALSSPNRGSLESGVAIQRGITGFKDQFKDNQTQIYDRLDKYIPKQSPTDVSGTIGTLDRLTGNINGAPSLSGMFKNERIGSIANAIKSDATQGGGLLNAPANRLPFEAVKQTRTAVGNELADNSLISAVPRSKWAPLYGALSRDMQGAAAAVGPQATGALNRANNYSRAGIERLERVAPFADKVAPEAAFQLLQGNLRENVSTLQAVKKTLPEGARGTVAGTVIERLGMAKPGQQNDAGNAWSPETFLSNWNRMKPAAQKELLSGFPNSAQVMKDVSAVAKGTAMMRDNSKLWANSSGTGSNVAARATLGAIGAGGAGALTGLLNPAIPLGAAGGLLGTNMLARGMTRQGTVDSMTKRTYIDPEILNAQLAGLLSGELLQER